MAECIERKALLEALENADPDVYEDYGDGTVDWGFGRKNIQDIINSIPAADVAPVVRCKDCKYYRNHPNGLCYLHTEPKENERGYSGEAICVEPDDFCSYGERREE